MYTTTQRVHAARRSAQCWENLRVLLLDEAFTGKGEVKDERAREAVRYANSRYHAATLRISRLVRR